MPSWPDVFQFGTFFSVALNDFKCIIARRPSSSPCNCFSMLFIHSGFSLCSSRSHILLQSYFTSFASGCWYILEHSPPRCFFRYFGIFCFDCIIWSCLGIFYYYHSLRVFPPVFTDDFPWNLSDDKSPQVYKTLLSILADLNAIILMVLILSLIFNSFSLSSKPLGTVPSAPNTNGITVLWQSLSICITFHFIVFSHSYLPQEQHPDFTEEELDEVV